MSIARLIEEGFRVNLAAPLKRMLDEWNDLLGLFIGWVGRLTQQLAEMWGLELVIDPVWKHCAVSAMLLLGSAVSVNWVRAETEEEKRRVVWQAALAVPAALWFGITLGLAFADPKWLGLATLTGDLPLLIAYILTLIPWPKESQDRRFLAAFLCLGTFWLLGWFGRPGLWTTTPTQLKYLIAPQLVLTMALATQPEALRVALVRNAPPGQRLWKTFVRLEWTGTFRELRESQIARSVFYSIAGAVVLVVLGAGLPG